MRSKLLVLGSIFLLLVTGVFCTKAKLALFVWKTVPVPALALALDSHNPVLLRDIGNFYFSSEHYDIQKAEKYFKEAIEVDVTIPLVHYQLARVHFINGEFIPAIKEIDKEIELYPNYKRSFYVRGLVYGYLDNFDRAASDFQTFLEAYPNSWAGHNDLSWIYFKKGDFISARDVAQKGLQHYPDNPWLLNSLGIALLNLEQGEEAKRVFEESLKHFENLDTGSWGRAYPGNNPKIYSEGLHQTKDSVMFNMSLLE